MVSIDNGAAGYAPEPGQGAGGGVSTGYLFLHCPGRGRMCGASLRCHTHPTPPNKGASGCTPAGEGYKPLPPNTLAQIVNVYFSFQKYTRFLAILLLVRKPT